MKSLRDIRVIKVNPRDAGRVRLDRAVRDLRPYLKDVIPFIDMPDEVASRFAFFCEWVDEIEDNAAAIVDDDEAGRMLRNVAYAITHAFELGRGAGEGPPIRDLHRRRIRARPGRQEGGRNGGRAKREAAAKWHRAAWPIWWDACGQYPKTIHGERFGKR